MRSRRGYVNNLCELFTRPQATDTTGHFPVFQLGCSLKFTFNLYVIMMELIKIWYSVCNALW